MLDDLWRKTMSLERNWRHTPTVAAPARSGHRLNVSMPFVELAAQVVIQVALGKTGKEVSGEDAKIVGGGQLADRQLHIVGGRTEKPGQIPPRHRAERFGCRHPRHLTEVGALSGSGFSSMAVDGIPEGGKDLHQGWSVTNVQAQLT